MISLSETQSPRGVSIWTRDGILLSFSVAFLLAPKIDVVAVLRVEDFVFLGVLPVLIWRYAPMRTAFPGFMNWYFAYLIVALLSAIVNFSSLGLFGPINLARQIQYLIWFLVGAQMAATIPEQRFNRAMTFVSGVLILWWIGEISGAIPKFGKFTETSSRVTLNTSGPYEISVVVVFLMLFARSKLILLGLIGILLTTQSRITLAAALIVYLIRNPRHALIIGAPAALAVSFLLLVNSSILANSRIADTMNPLEMWQAWRAHLAAAPMIVDLPEYRYYAYETIWDRISFNTDVSLELRLIRWALIVKSISTDWVHLLIGWGPGAWGAAVDSHVIRFLGEVGVIGSFVFALFAGAALLSPRVPAHVRSAMLILVICSLFIDVMTSSKIMSFFWIFSGYTYAKLQSLSCTRSPGRVGTKYCPRRPQPDGRG